MGFMRRRIRKWVTDVFGRESFEDLGERAVRCLEEALELAQASGVSKAVARALVHRVYERRSGTVRDEAGDVLFCLLALAESHDLDVEGDLNRKLDDLRYVDPEYFRGKQREKAEAGVSLVQTLGGD